jgi:predicted metalloprotease
MRLDDVRQSGNVEDRRGMRVGGGGFRTGGLGLGGLLIVLAISYFAGVDPMTLLSPDQAGTGVDTTAPAPTGPPADQGGQFASKILADTEDTWTAIFSKAGSRYAPPTLVLFSDQVDSACGLASTAVGPFYCPGDRKVYLDLAFFNELSRRFGAPGDFAQAYVIAHEVGHHVQNLTGAFGNTAGMARRDANAQSVRTELQADCLAGVWGHAAATRGLLEAGDAEEGIKAAAAVGDDRLQQQSQGRVVPDAFTHGSSADRVAAFRRGFENGEISACGLGR